jgi:hypothetical protein
MINKYYEFLLEKQIYNLILEGKMIFGTDFIEILDALSTNQDDMSVANLAAVIRGYANKDVDVDANCIDVSDKPGMITFVPDDKVKEDELTYRVLPIANVLTYDTSSPHALFKELDVPGEGLVNGDIRGLLADSWKVIKNPTSQIWSHLNFFYLEDANTPGRRVLVYTSTRTGSSETRSPIEPNGSTSTRKSDVRLGRFLNKFIAAVSKDFNNNMGITAATIEKFVNLYEAEVIIRENSLDNFKVVEGEDIRKWYHQKYYEGDSSGQLSNSCMRYPTCQDYFDIYVQNPEVCKMVIYLNEFNQLRGRALLWTLSDGKKYMDRIYTSKDSYETLFLKWGSKNGYSKTIKNNSVVNVKPGDYELYPYMDTFQYYDADEGRLSDSKIFQRPYAELDTTDGDPDWRT